MPFRKTYSWLMPSLQFSTLLIVTRIVYTGSMCYCFLVWNLFLAILPLYFSYRALLTQNNAAKWTYLVIWLLFFPNASYITTDLFHLRDRYGAPLWYDLILLFSSALNGIILGMLSLYNVEKLLRPLIGNKYIPIIRFMLLMLCGYGIYLGRYLRWNSWDIFTDPFSLLNDMAYHVIHPFRNHEVWMITLVFAVWMQLIYRYILRLKQRS